MSLVKQYCPSKGYAAIIPILAKSTSLLIAIIPATQVPISLTKRQLPFENSVFSGQGEHCIPSQAGLSSGHPEHCPILLASSHSQ